MPHSTNDRRDALRILIVEDEALVAFELEFHLCEAGHKVVGTADDLESAIKMAAVNRVDLALVDMQLAAGSDGRDVARALKGFGVPSLFATGNCPGLPQAGAVGCLHKPFGPVDLLEAVAAASAISQGRRPERVPAVMEVYSR